MKPLIHDNLRLLENLQYAVEEALGNGLFNSGF